MDEKPLITPSFLRTLLIGVGLLAALNIVNDLLGAPFWLVTRLIHLGSDSNISAWYSSCLLAVAGLIAFDCFRIAKTKAVRGGWAFGLIAITLIFMSCDEIAQFHEILGGYIAKQIGLSAQHFAQHAAWVWLGGPFIIVLFLVLIVLLRKPLSLVSGSSVLLSLGFGLIVLGGIVLESTINWLNHDELQWLWNIEIVAEETLEMLGSLVLAYAFSLWSTRIHARLSPLLSEPA